MKKQILSLLTLLLLISFGCNEDEPKIAANQDELEFLNTISTESSAMLKASFEDFNEVFSTNSVSEMQYFEASEFSRISVLGYVKTSDFLSPHYDLIEVAINSDEFSPNARTSGKKYFNDEEQPYADAFSRAFSLLPNTEAFEEALIKIESEIALKISD